MGLAQGAFAQPASPTAVEEPLHQAAPANAARRAAQFDERAVLQRYGIPASAAAQTTPLAGRYGVAGLDPVPAKEWLRFDLDFPGGTPEELIRFLREEAGQPVNAIIPEDVADTRLPAIRVANVTLTQLFQAIEAASRKTTLFAVSTSRSAVPGRAPMVNYQTHETGYGFRTAGEPGDNAIWQFYREEPPVMPEPKPAREVRFFQLAPYLDTLDVEDITTAIRTGWELLGVEDLPTLKFHQETKLLIAVGDPGLLATIDEVLRQLRDGLSDQNPFTRPAR